MTVTPLMLLKKKEYTPIPEGMGEEPTRYQVGEDPAITVTLKFPTMGLVETFQSSSDNNIGRSKDTRQSLREYYPDYELAKIIVNGELPEPESVHPGMITRLVMDFMHASLPITNGQSTS